MKLAYFDCFSGAAGDMILGALVAAGVPAEALRADVQRLGLAGYELIVQDVRKQGFAATQVRVTCAETAAHRHLRDIVSIIDAADISASAKEQSTLIFTRLAEAEAAVHGTGIDKVHFHEVGAVDAIVDIVGAVLGLERLGVDHIVCSPIPPGSGTVQCEHGTLPVPAPATAQLLRGIPLAPCDEPGELTTPTGAAILTTLAARFGPLPAMRIESCGYGAGSRAGKTRPNLLRLIVGETADIHEKPDESDEVVLLEVNLDDATGEQIGHAFDSLLAAGALDVYTTPIMMKKSRPAVQLSALVSPDRVPACEEVLFSETTTFGIRRLACTRSKLGRRSETVTTRYGPIRVKIGRRGGRVMIASPEYEDCAEAARQHGVSLREVMFESQRAWRAAHEAAEL